MGEKSKWAELLEVPRAFLYGLLGGVFGPLVALAATIGVIYAATGHLPAFKEVTRSDGTRQRAISLSSPLEARASWARYGGELRGAMLEVRARLNARTE